jgi:hypothetical protein
MKIELLRIRDCVEALQELTAKLPKAWQAEAASHGATASRRSPEPPPPPRHPGRAGQQARAAGAAPRPRRRAGTADRESFPGTRRAVRATVRFAPFEAVRSRGREGLPIVRSAVAGTVRPNCRRIDAMELGRVNRQRAVRVARGGNPAALDIARQGRLGLADGARRLAHRVQHQGCASFG